MRTCPRCGTENPHSTRFCMTCGTAVGSERPAPESRKTVTVVFSDVAGSTRSGERLDPEIIRFVMTRDFDAMKAVLNFDLAEVLRLAGRTAEAAMPAGGVPTVDLKGERRVREQISGHARRINIRRMIRRKGSASLSY